jgi:hypothetical protein
VELLAVEDTAVEVVGVLIVELWPLEPWWVGGAGVVGLLQFTPSHAATVVEYWQSHESTAATLPDTTMVSRLWNFF